MGILDSLIGIGGQIGSAFLGAELQRKQQRQVARSQMSFSSNGTVPGRVGTQFPQSQQPTPKLTLPSGGTTQLAIPSGLSNRAFKDAMCKAVRERLVHPAVATAELKMRGMKGCVRRMNPLNPRALTRAARRMEGFLRTVKRIEKAIPTKTRRVRSTAGHTHALKSTGVIQGGG